MVKGGLDRSHSGGKESVGDCVVSNVDTKDVSGCLRGPLEVFAWSEKLYHSVLEFWPFSNVDSHSISVQFSVISGKN